MGKSKKRDFFTYNLYKDKKIVYIGKTKDLETTEQRHKDDGKKFISIKKTSNKMTNDGAEKKEGDNLKIYRKSHGGDNPKYNKTDDG
ncbi:MAG: hypothetical protein IIA48_09385 [Bacteroidetes bacterium]|nr:hypothetical protein [Bacteroidota bacterium]